MSPRRLPHLALLLAATLLVAACGSGDDDADTVAGDPGRADDGDTGSGDAAGGGSTRPWIAGSWVLQSATGDAGPLTLPGGLTLPLEITGPDRIGGNAGCNSFSGSIEAGFDGANDGGPLAITKVAMTEMACEHLEFEAAYLDLIGRVTEWGLTPPSGLVFRGDGIELVYGIGDAPAERSLEGTIWVFDTIFAGEGVERTASSTRLDKAPVTAEVADGVLTLTSDGCTPVEVSVDYEPGANEGAFTVEDPAALADLVDCADPDSNLVAAVDGVAMSTSLQIVDGRLTLIGLPGETISFASDES